MANCAATLAVHRVHAREDAEHDGERGKDSCGLPRRVEMTVLGVPRFANANGLRRGCTSDAGGCTSDRGGCC
jgi:hypothetical protein